MSKYAHIPQQKILPVDLGQNPPTIIIANAASVTFAPSSLWTFSPTQLCLMPLCLSPPPPSTGNPLVAFVLRLPTSLSINASPLSFFQTTDLLVKQFIFP